MRKMFAIAAAMLFTATGHAAPGSVESIETLLAATKAESMIDSAYAAAEQMIRQSMAQATQGKPVSAEQQRVLDAAPAKFVAVMRDEMSWARMKPHFVKMYGEVFDQAEIDGLIAFYRSPIGQAFVDKMPLVMQKSMSMTQSLMQSMIPKMQATMEAAMAEAQLTK